MRYYKEILQWEIDYRLIQNKKMLSKISSPIAKAMPTHFIDFFGRDGMLFSALPYYTLTMVMIIGLTLYQLTKNPYLLLFIIYGILPMIDQVLTIDTRNPTTEQSKSMRDLIKFEVPLYVTVVIDWMIFFYALNEYRQAQLNLKNTLKLIGFVIVISNLNAAQFSVSHQILHKPGWRRIIGTLHMLKTLNMHFTYQHIYGHHRKVATLQDPATSRYNQNVYHFFVRSYFGAYKSVYEMEKKSGKPFYANCTTMSIIASLIFCGIIFHFYGLQAFVFYLVQVLGAVFYLEVINFTEHYGLLRKKLPNGEYQKVTIKHSWNAPHRFSNYLFFKLQRHSHHHENSMEPYQTLLTLDESPQLPHGYIFMTVMALFPEVYRRIMNPLVNQEQGNVHVKEQLRLQQIAIQQTRKFIMEVSLSTLCLFVLSFLWAK